MHSNGNKFFIKIIFDILEQKNIYEYVWLIIVL